MKHAVLVVLLGLGACATPPRAKHAALPGARTVQARPHDEDKLGRRIDEALRRRYTLYDDARLVGYVQRVGARVARQTPCGACRWTFRVLDLSAVNAFSFPGGYVYITRGMLAELGSEAELAAVLGHEVGHIAAHHSLDEHSWLEEQLGAPGRAELIHFYERSRDNEREADQLAVEYLARAGYDPHAMARMLAALADVERAEGERDSTSIWDDHPATSARVARAALSAARFPGGLRGRARYLAAIDGLVVGEDPRRGYIAGQRFVRPDADFMLRLPHGWKSSVGDGTLLSYGATGSDLLLLFRTRHRTLAGARAAFFDDDVRHDELVHRRLGGLRALVRARIAGEKKQLVFAMFEAGSHAFLLLGNGDAARDDVLGGLSPISGCTLAHVRPRRLSVTRLGRPATLRRLSSGKAELAELVELNHVSADSRLPAGRFVKRITPGSANVAGRGSGTPRPVGDRLGGAGRHPGVEHLAHARQDGHRGAHQRAARREHP